MADKLNQRATRDVQLNEKVSTTQYDVLHPETTALQVITDKLHRFVTDEQIEQWTKGQGSLHFRGEWSSGTHYEAGDLVSYKDFYFLCGVTHNSRVANTPKTDANITEYNNGQSYWYNLDYESYQAEKARRLRTVATSSAAEMYPTFVSQNNSNTGGDEDKKYEYYNTNQGLHYNPSTETLTVANINGTATEAKHAAEADHALRADDALRAVDAENADTAVNYKNTAVETGKSNIQTTIEGLNKRIDDITSGTGGAVLSNRLFIQKNGTALNPNGFDGSEKQIVNITIQPADVVGLLNSTNKIDSKWLPDSILGNLRYSGTVNEMGVLTGYTEDSRITNIKEIDYKNYPDKYYGIYFLAAFENIKIGADLVGVKDLRHGDWIVCNGISGWVKVDNTDAVTMVNGQTGAIETFKGDWKTKTHYYKGDIIKWNNTLYVVNQAHDTSTNWTITQSYYEVFGRIYQATDGIKLDQDGVTFKHDVTIESGVASDKDLTYGSSFTVPSIKTDAYGHTTKVDLINYTLPTAIDDTWRNVVINGKQLLDNSLDSGSLEINDGNLIDVLLDGKVISFNHTPTGYDASNYRAEKIETVTTSEIDLAMGNGFTVPQFDYDAYGHIRGVTKGTYRLPSAIMEHKHFDIKVKDGVSTIQAYENPNNSWANESSNALKFYTGNTVPVQSAKMVLNASLGAHTLYQRGTKNNITSLYPVIDETATICSGVNKSGSKIIGNFKDNEFLLGKVFEKPGTYSVVAVNEQGIVTYGGAILEFGHIDKDNPAANEPSTSLAVGGLFFRQIA